MRIGIIQFPGSNCERETMLAIKRARMEPVEFLWNEPIERLTNFDGFVIVGGFSYEDRSRAGIIAALDPVMQEIKNQSALGKPILGICNGAQILIESGLVPGIKDNQPCMALTDNKRMLHNKIVGTGYYNAWIHMRLADGYQQNVFTRYLNPSTILRLPIAHAEGRFVIPPNLLAEIIQNGLNVFQYCDASGKIINEFPVNPNGSIENIAAVSNQAGNVMAIMPHPERTDTCDLIFQSMHEYIKDQLPLNGLPLNYRPNSHEAKTYLPTGKECIVSYLITDNQALSVENALRKKQIPVSIKRYQHWEILCNSPDVLKKINASGLLYNHRKEKIVESILPIGKRFLVRPKEDILGLQKLQMLKNHFGVDGLDAIFHSTLWHVNGDENSINEVINCNILFNPCAHDYYNY